MSDNDIVSNNICLNIRKIFTTSVNQNKINQL